MPPYSTAVKLFRYTDGGAPEMKGAAGALLNVLDACLRTGYNVKAPTSVTRDGSVVTVVFSAAHGYTEHQVIEMSGANEVDYNGLFRVTSVTTLELTYSLAAGVTPATPATGTFATKVAPAGWTRAFTGTNKAAYKSSDGGDATGCYLRIDDTNATATRRGAMRGYISMSDIDTGTEPFPSSNLYWYKGADDNTARPWFIAADSRAFYIGVNPNNYGDFHGFGDFPSYKPGDIYNCFISGSSHATDDATVYADPLTATTFPHVQYTNSSMLVVARNYAGLENSMTKLQTVGCAPFMSASLTSSGYLLGIGGVGVTYPHPIDNGFIYGNTFFREQNATMQLIRGYPPGLYDPWHPVIASLNNVSLLAGAPAPEKKALLWNTRLCHGNAFSPSITPKVTECNPMINVTGPWR